MMDATNRILFAAAVDGWNASASYIYSCEDVISAHDVPASINYIAAGRSHYGF